MNRTKRQRWVFGLLIVGYMLTMIFGGCADQLILYPSTQPIDPEGAEQLLIKNNGQSIEVFRARSPGASHTGKVEAFALEFCGNATRAEDIASYVASRWGDHPVEVWVMNYPGYGQSTGPAKLKSIPPAALAAYDELAARAAGRPIFLAGQSLGSTAALYVASMRPTAGMIIQNPPPLQRMILQHFGWWNLWLLAGPVSFQIPSEMNSLINAPHVKSPAIFISATQDSTVPAKYHQMVIDAYAGPKRVIRLEGAEHNSPVVGDDEKRLLDAMDWLWTAAREQKPATD